MNINFLNIDSKENSTIQVKDSIFNCTYNEPLIHQIVISYQANSRGSNRAQKDRSEVRHSTRKPWKQKGTGRARAGMCSSPLWKGGGKIFPNSPIDNFSQKINKKMYRIGLCSIFSQLVRESRIFIINNFNIDSPKTKFLLFKFNDFILQSTLIITNIIDNYLLLASRNLVNIKIIEPKNINPILLIKFKKILMTQDALKKIEDWL